MNAKQRGEYFRKVERLRRQLENKYVKSFEKSILKQFDNFANRVKRNGIGAARSSLGLDLWEKDLMKLFENLYKESVITFGNAVYRALKIEANRKANTFGFNREWTNEIMAFLMKDGFSLVSNITSTTKKKLLLIVQKGVEEGLSVDEIVRLIKSDEQIAYAKFRAQKIVRTEVMRSSNMASIMAAKKHDFVVNKQWISARDSRTRRIPEESFDHVKLDGIVKEFDEPFDSTSKDGVEFTAQQPGDPSAPPGFTINCRCTIAFIPQRDKNGNLILKNKPNQPQITSYQEIEPLRNEIEQIVAKFNPGKTVKETKDNLLKYLRGKTGLNFDSVSVTKKQTLETLNKKSIQVAKLFDEYKVQTGIDTEKPIKIKFSSSKSILGVVKSKLGITNSGQVLGKPEITEINFGDRSERLNEITFVNGSTQNRFKSAVDEENRDLTVVTHEFAHALAINRQTMNPNTPQYVKDYFRDLRQIFENYKNEMLSYNQQKDLESVYNISLGRYASTNLDEFHAEGFKEYKLKKSPSKYAREIGELIDKYFKK
jgi:hypothetical protein